MQRDPDNGQAMTRQTRIQVAYDDRYLYIAMVCQDDAGRLVRRVSAGATSSRPPTWSSSRSIRATIIRRDTCSRPIRPDGRETSRPPTTTATIATTTRCGKCAPRSPTRLDRGVPDSVLADALRRIARARTGVGLQRAAADSPAERERHLGAEAARRARRGLAVRAPGLRSSRSRRRAGSN